MTVDRFSALPLNRRGLLKGASALAGLLALLRLFGLLWFFRLLTLGAVPAPGPGRAAALEPDPEKVQTFRRTSCGTTMTWKA